MPKPQEVLSFQFKGHTVTLYKRDRGDGAMPYVLFAVDDDEPKFLSHVAPGMTRGYAKQMVVRHLVDFPLHLTKRDSADRAAPPPNTSRSDRNTGRGGP